MFMNRGLLRQEIVEQNELSPTEEAAVFSILKPFKGLEEKTRFLEAEADAAIGEVRRPRDSHPLFVRVEEDRSVIDFNGTMEPLERIADGLDRLIEVLVPKTEDLVGTEYIAKKLGVSKQWVGTMAGGGTIPKNCIAPKVSGGRIWKFHRDKIDAWLTEQR